MTDAPPDLLIPTLGTTTRAWTAGPDDGAPLILVHGFRGDHHGLDGIGHAIAELVPEVRILVPDLPGFGATPAVPGRTHDLALYGEWLRAFATAAAPEGYGVLGHSFGSLVVAAAIDQGLEPGRAILVNPISAPALEGPNAPMTRLATVYYRAARALPEAGARRLLGNPAIVRLMSEVMAKTRDRQLRAWIHDQHDRYFSVFADPATLLEAFQASVSHTVTEVAEAFTMPTLVVAGERDDLSTPVDQLGLVRRLPDARLRVIPGAGHLVHYEAVADTAAWTAAFLRETQRTTAAAHDREQTGEEQE